MASLADALAYQQKRQQMLNALNDQPTDLEKAVQDQFGMQPNMDRAALLPYKSKDKGWVAPEAVYQLAKLLASPATALKGGNISNQEAIEAGNTLSGFMTPAGLASKIEPGMARMNVYHGSPHTFDAFDASKIGTGEGAQAYGHGLYLAESPKVASGYKESLSGGAKKVLNASFSKDPELWAAGQVYSKIPDRDIIEGLSILGYKGDPKSLVNSAKGRLNNELSSAGNLYKVDLPDEMIARMLDWYKPLSQQPKEAQQPLRDMWIKAKKSFSGIDPNADPTAGQIHHLYQQHRGGNSAAVADELRNAGIPGIKYLDEQSLAKGAGTSNFVVFPGEEHNLKILKRE